MVGAVSIVIPAYNEGARFARSLPQLRAALEANPALEVIIVDDGSTDDTVAVVLEQLGGWDSARLVRLPWNGGKGAAVKAGVAVAQGDITCFMDADLSADLAHLPRLLRALDNADIALGSRTIAGSRAVYGNKMRRVTSKVFNTVVCAVAGVIAADTQCGFKAFRTPAAKMLFHLARVDGFAFDVEVLALAQLLGYRIAEVPVGWIEAPGTTVHPLRDPARMLRDVAKTRLRYRRELRDATDEPPTAPAESFSLAHHELAITMAALDDEMRAGEPIRLDGSLDDPVVIDLTLLDHRPEPGHPGGWPADRHDPRKTLTDAATPTASVRWGIDVPPDRTPRTDTDRRPSP